MTAVTLGLAGPLAAGSLPDTIERVARSVVLVGTYAELRQPPGEFLGTGFAVADGHRVVTNAHVLPDVADREHDEHLAVFARAGERVSYRRAEVVARDPEHDLALLRVAGDALPPMTLGDSESVRPGERFAFTGFPIGTVLGVQPVTHEAMISAVTPIAIPRGQAKRLDPATIKRLRNPYTVFQLDGTAYPGNSGSPLYDPESGRVVGVVNMVFVKRSKENVLRDPSGIAYAIPARYVRTLLESSRGD